MINKPNLQQQIGFLNYQEIKHWNYANLYRPHWRLMWYEVTIGKLNGMTKTSLTVLTSIIQFSFTAFEGIGHQP